MKQSDDFRPPQTGALKGAGAGLNIGRECWWCKQSKTQAGGRMVGPLRLFKCAACLAAPKEKP